MIFPISWMSTFETIAGIADEIAGREVNTILDTFWVQGKSVCHPGFVIVTHTVK